MKRFQSACLLLASALSLSGCAASLQRTDKVAADYNRVFANSRTENILQNVLRAWADEPLQFSTVGTVSGTVRTTGTLSVPINNIILGGDESINPTIGFGGGPNPSVSFIPLSSKEFTQGILRPIPAETMDFLIGQRWDRSLVLPLAIGGVTCNNGSVVLAKGDDFRTTWEIFYAAYRARDFSLVKTTGKEVAKLRLLPNEVATLLKDGPGEGRTIAAIKPFEPQPKTKPRLGEQEVQIRSKGGTDAQGIALAGLCDTFPAPVQLMERDGGPAEEPVAGLLKILDDVPETGSATARPDGLLIRSVGSIFQFLAELHRIEAADELARCGVRQFFDPYPNGAAIKADVLREFQTARLSEAARLSAFQGGVDVQGRKSRLRDPEEIARLMASAKEGEARARRQVLAGQEDDLGSPLDLFRVQVACAGEAAPRDAVVTTRFQGRTYYILPRHHPRSARYRNDRTLETLSLLSDLISLQTSEASVTASSPVIAIQQ